MPTYEYRCPNGHKFDRIAKMSESAAELPCPECGELAVRQLSGGAGLIFKGSGFYLTDYGKNAHRAGGGETIAAAEKKHSESGGSEKSGDSKPAEPKSESKTESKPAESKPADAKSSDAKAKDAKPSASSAASTPKTDK